MNIVSVMKLAASAGLSTSPDAAYHQQYFYLLFALLYKQVAQTDMWIYCTWTEVILSFQTQTRVKLQSAAT